MEGDGGPRDGAPRGVPGRPRGARLGDLRGRGPRVAVVLGVVCVVLVVAVAAVLGMVMAENGL